MCSLLRNNTEGSASEHIYHTAKFDNNSSSFVFVLECIKVVNCLRLNSSAAYVLLI